jgi:hypothetical protein
VLGLGENENDLEGRVEGLPFLVGEFKHSLKVVLETVLVDQKLFHIFSVEDECISSYIEGSFEESLKFLCM